MDELVSNANVTSSTFRCLRILYRICTITNETNRVEHDSQVQCPRISKNEKYFQKYAVNIKLKQCRKEIKFLFNRFERSIKLDEF